MFPDMPLFPVSMLLTPSTVRLCTPPREPFTKKKRFDPSAGALAMPGARRVRASGLRPFRLFGTVEMPKLVAPDEGIANNALAAHELLFLGLVALIALHVGAALYHHMFLRDGTLQRMLPRRR